MWSRLSCAVAVVPDKRAFVPRLIGFAAQLECFHFSLQPTYFN
jgi:hypothetical protein